MDINCATCNEPWSFHYLVHEENIREEPFTESGFVTDPAGSLNVIKCPACWTPGEPEKDDKKGRTVSTPHGEVSVRVARRAIAELMGDDIDGFTTFCDDMGL